MPTTKPKVILLMTRDDARDAATLRDAAWVLRTRAHRRNPHAVVVAALLRRAADRIDPQPEKGAR